MSAKRRAAGPPRTRRPGRRRGLGGWLWWLVRWGLVLGLVLALIGLAGLVYLYQTTPLPDPNKDFQTQTTTIYYADGKQELGTFATQNRTIIPLSQMPQQLQDAVVAAENRSFWTDRGIDPVGIARAFYNNLRGRPVQGASTITQQYIKVLYLTSERSLTRKAKEAVLSLKIRRELSKQEILQGYLNTIYFGRGAYGVEAAAQAFFAKSAAELNLRECAVLASVLNNPSAMDPANGREAKAELKGRYRYVLDGMVEMGTLDQAEADRAARRLPAFPEIEAESQYGGQRGHMLELVRTELRALGYSDEVINGGGLKVTTTLTPEAMAAAEQGMAAQRPEGFTGPLLHVAVATVEVGTGALRGFYGGQDYLKSQINWASAGGMAGSTFKAFALAAAIKDGYSLKDTFDGNSPIDLPGNVSFRNQGDTDYGSAISMIKATEDSVNTAFIDMVYSMPNGPQKVIAAAEAMGIPGNEAGDFGIPDHSIDLQPIVGVPLGTVQVSPINLANAYATIANGGVRQPVHVIERVEEANGEQTYQFEPDPVRAMSTDIAADVSYALQQVVTNGSGHAALDLGRPAAGKTGTATNDKDQVSSSWFVGYTPQLATAVMYVRGKGREQLDGWLPEYFGGSYPARTWTDVMRRLSTGMPVEDFPEPAYVDGDAPDEGHDPAPDDGGYTPRPAPGPRPTRRPAPQPTLLPTRLPTGLPSQPEPTLPGPTEPEPTQPEPTQPAPEPTQPEPQPTQPEPQPTQPAPSASAGVVELDLLDLLERWRVLVDR